MRSCRHRRLRRERSPSRLPPYSLPLRGVRRRAGWFDFWAPCGGSAGGPAGALARDELLQPTDLALTCLKAVLLMFHRVRVEPFRRAGQHVAQTLPALLDPAPPALENA